MAAENAKELFNMLKTDPRAKELLHELEKPENPDDILKAYADLAGKLGISLTEEELKSYLGNEAKTQESRTDAAAAKITELPDEAMDAVAGGGDHEDCKDTFRDHENCWVNDGCDAIYHKYDDYGCYWNVRSSCLDGEWTFVS